MKWHSMTTHLDKSRKLRLHNLYCTMEKNSFEPYQPKSSSGGLIEQNFRNEG